MYSVSEQPDIYLSIKDISKVTIYIVQAQWHTTIVDLLYKDVCNTLEAHKVLPQNIHQIKVPGSYELPLATQWAAKKKIHAIIPIGCIIKGATTHFELISQNITQAFTNLSLQYNTPIISGVLTTYTYQQAWERTTGSVEKKGVSVAQAALSMIALQKKMTHV